MLGILFAFLAGLFIAMQNVCNTNVNKFIGTWETTSIVHLIGLFFSLLMVLLFSNRNYAPLEDMNKLYLFGGVFGVLIVYTVVRSISLGSVALTMSILVVTQLIASALIDHFGLFGMDQVAFNPTKIVGSIIMIAGVIIFQLK